VSTHADARTPGAGGVTAKCPVTLSVYIGGLETTFEPGAHSDV